MVSEQSRAEIASSSSRGSHKPCCSPQADSHTLLPAESFSTVSRSDPKLKMIRLTGGPFLMGTDFAESFAQDGEGPVRRVELSPFWIDRSPVTNADFHRFVEDTGYLSEAERFGWSFVFWAHIPEHRFEELVLDTVAGAPWWCKVPGANWLAAGRSGFDCLFAPRTPCRACFLARRGQLLSLGRQEAAF